MFDYLENFQALIQRGVPFDIPASCVCSFQYLHILNNACYYLTLKKRFYLFIFREREGKEKEKERNINMRLPPVYLPLRTWLTTQACDLTRSQTGDPLIHRPVLNPLSHTSQGWRGKILNNSYRS